MKPLVAIAPEGTTAIEAIAEATALLRSNFPITSPFLDAAGANLLRASGTGLPSGLAFAAESREGVFLDQLEVSEM